MVNLDVSLFSNFTKISSHRDKSCFFLKNFYLLIRPKNERSKKEVVPQVRLCLYTLIRNTSRGRSSTTVNTVNVKVSTVIFLSNLFDSFFSFSLFF